MLAAQKCRIFDVDRLRCNHIAVSNVNMHGQARASEFGHEVQPDASIFVFLACRGGTQRLGPEDYPVLFNLCGKDFDKYGGDCSRSVLAKTEEIKVAGSTVGHRRAHRLNSIAPFRTKRSRYGETLKR